MLEYGAGSQSGDSPKKRSPGVSDDFLRTDSDLEREVNELLNSEPEPLKPTRVTSKRKKRTSSTNNRNRRQGSRLAGAQNTNDDVLMGSNMTGSATSNRGELVRSEPDVFVNIGLVEFGLKMELQDSGLVDQIHMFNTLFFRYLDAGRGKGAHCRRVKKWTSKCDIFSKSFVIVPINEQLCWYLAIICFPGCILRPPDKTRVVILDPYGREHLRTIRILREYLQYEARERHGKVVDTTDTEIVDGQHLLMPLVLKEYHCGIYLLHYLKMFLANPLEIMALPPYARDRGKGGRRRFDELWRTDQVKGKQDEFRKKRQDLSAEWLAFKTPDFQASRGCI